jgi:ABC-type transport system substrate-binding protein
VTLHGTTSSFPDYLDPALSISLEGWSAMWNTYVPLLTYQHADGRAGTKLIPGLARSLPRVSADGRTYTLYLREGLRYSDGSPVRASDFRHEIERVLALHSGGSPFFTHIVGAERFAETGKGGIGGIKTDDASGRIAIELTEPRGTFPYELATLYSAPVPSDTPVEDRSQSPPPATGPYEIVSTRPGRDWTYRRNPEWDAHNAELMPQIPGGHFGKIEIDVIKNPETQVNEVENGHFDWMVNPPPPDRLVELEHRFEGTQLIALPQINVFYFWMNTSAPPFDDVRVRRAVNYAIDPAALERIYAGQLSPLQQVLPPAMPGHQSFRPYPHDIAKARALIAAANPSDRDHGLDQQLPAAPAGQRVLRKRAARTRLRDEAESARPDQLLRRDRQPDDARPRHRLGQLAARLPAPERLLRTAADRRRDPVDEQHQLGAVRRPGDRRRSDAAAAPATRPAAGSRLRQARPQGDARGSVGAVRHAPAADLHLRGDRSRQARRQPDLRPGPDQLPAQR